MYLVYFLKHKDEAFAYLKKFKNYVEKHSGYYLKFLRTDKGGGGGFSSNKFLGVL